MDTLKPLQAEPATELDGLLPSILEEAFRGNYDECSSRLFTSAFPLPFDRAFEGEL